MELSKQQQKIIESTATKVIVNASAASGKTRTMTERIRFLLANNVKPDKIVAITFTNNAAVELMERLGDVAQGIHCQTIHSYANFLLKTIGIDTSDYIAQENFDKFFELIQEHPECVQEVDHLLLDESQDSTEQQFEFILDIIKPKNWMLFGDHRQSIYRFAGANPDYLIRLMQKPDITVYSLIENYRNKEEILEFAQSTIRIAGTQFLDYSKSMCGAGGKVIRVAYNPDAIVRTIAKYNNYKDWFILVRLNSQMDAIMKACKIYGVPFDTFKKAQLTNAELASKMQENTVKILTIHSAKGLEAKNVVVIGAHYKTEEEICISYVAATRAKDLLVWTHSPSKNKYTKNVINWE